MFQYHALPNLKWLALILVACCAVIAHGMTVAEIAALK